MADYDERSAVAAARILLSLRTRKLTRWPDYSIQPDQPPSEELDAPAPSAEPEFELPPLPEGWPKRPRGPLFARASGWSPSLDGLFARLGRQQQHVPARSGAAEETARSPHRVREIKREFLPARRRSASDGSGGVSTSGAGEKVAARKEEAFVAASSPETPLDYAAAARSGASSSGDEGERSTAKRKARGTRRRSSSGDEGCSARADVDAAAARSGASSSGDEGERSTAKRKARATTRRSSSGDEGCSAPTKRARAADEDAAASAQATPAAVKVEVLKIEENYRDEKGHLLFDLNEDISMAWED